MRHFDKALRGTWLLCLATVALTLAACGAGGTESSSDGAVQFAPPSIGSALKITTTTLPMANTGVAYDQTTLTATGGTGSVEWHLAGGQLPPGLTLTRNGAIAGTPTSTGFYSFTAEARDGQSADQQSLVLSVDTFGIHASEGLVFGDAWSGKPVTLQCAGHTHEVQFRSVRSDSRGSFMAIDPQGGKAVWLPGPNATPGAQDVIEAVCNETDTTVEITLDVAPDTTAGHVAEFATTDVWFMDFDKKHGAHPFHSDWHAALHELGLRTSTSLLGHEADQLCELLCRVTVLRHLNAMYLRNMDGSAGPNGLAISFPLERPGQGYGTPVPGSLVTAGPTLYSTMAICDQSGSLSAYGVAITDVIGNPRVEHNAPGGAAGELGVFTNHIAHTVKNTFREFGDALREDPIDADDIDALKALLYGRSNPGGRYEMISYFVNAFGEAVAYIAAHEVGHSLGLHHTRSYTPGSIMNTVGIISPGVDHYFLDEDIANLRLGLPGGGRITGAQKISTAQMAIVTVCDGKCHGK